MYKGKTILAVIPARSGSKGLKDKNIKELNGKPLMAYSIETAKKAELFDDIIVSTDSEKYAKIAVQYGASVPFLRSSENSSDKAGSWDVVKEVLEKLDKPYDIVILLQPTSPLREAKDIIEALNLFFEKNADTLFSVCEAPHPIFWGNTLDETLSAKNFIKKEYQKSRQELPKSYCTNGAVYIIKSKNIDNLDFYSDKSYVYIMKQENSIDIDTELDFLMAECLLNKLNNCIKK